MAAIAAHGVTRQWWQLTGPCQERLSGTPEGEQWATMTEVFHVD
jgi:L-rhamnose mutarotase